MYNIKKVGEEWWLQELPSNRILLHLDKDKAEQLSFLLQVALYEEDLEKDELCNK